jgi:hypothetical protein
VQYGQALSFRINVNNGKIGWTNCSVSNSGQQTCNNSSGGANPTKMLLASGNQYMYVLNEGGTSPASAGNIALFTLGGSGTVYSTGQTYSTPSAGQNPVDMVLGAGGSYIYVLYQYQPATVSGCANPTPTTCAGAIGLYAIGPNGNLSPVPANNNNPTPIYFPTGYIPDQPDYVTGFGGNHFYLASGNLYLLDNNGSTHEPEVNSFSIANTSTGQLSNTTNVATGNSAFVAPVAITGSGSDVFVADAFTGAIWTYGIPSGGNGALTGVGQFYFCPANPTYPYTSGGIPTQGTTANGPGCASANGQAPFVVLDSLLVSNTGSVSTLYAADNSVATNTGTVGNIYPMTFPSSGSNILSLASGPNPVPLGSSVTCMTVSTGLPFLYVSGNGGIAGEQINTQTGNLTTQYNQVTTASIQGFAPCLMFSSRR